jgi:hypothetical protein
MDVVIWHWIVHTLGVDNGLRYGTWNWYNFESGSGSDIGEATVALALLTAIYGWYRKNNCHAPGCPRIGLHHLAGGEFRVCGRHHPHERRLTLEHIHLAHARHLASQEVKADGTA